MNGMWSLTQIPGQFPQCCRLPSVEITSDLEAKSATSITTKVGLDWSLCSMDIHGDSGQHQPTKGAFNFRLVSNDVLSATLLMQLPWPFSACNHLIILLLFFITITALTSLFFCVCARHGRIHDAERRYHRLQYVRSRLRMSQFPTRAHRHSVRHDKM